MAEDAATVGQGAVTGAAQGAAVGSVAGPVGTVVGAIVGGVIGAIGGIFSSQSKRYQKKADQQAQEMQDREAALQRRNIVRDQYVARAQAIAASAAEDGALMSSAPLGAISSIASQGAFNTDYFDSQVINQKQRNYWLKKAHKKQQDAGTAFQVLDTASSLAGSGLFDSFASSIASSKAVNFADSAMSSNTQGVFNTVSNHGYIQTPQ